MARVTRDLPLALTLCAVVASSALAGPNANGTLVLGEMPPLSPTCGDPCLSEWLDCYPSPDQCATLETSANEGPATVIGVFAAFNESTDPNLHRLSFGLDYDSEFLVVFHGCPIDGSAIPDDGWPAPGSGTLITLDVPSADSFRHIYAFVAYGYYGPGTVDLIGHPEWGATFFDDSTPPEEDLVVALGSFGFGVDGTLPCAEQLGACCLDERCELRFEDQCADAGGAFWGSDSDCSTIDCAPTPVQKRSWGAIKAAQR